MLGSAARLLALVSITIPGVALFGQQLSSAAGTGPRHAGAPPTYEVETFHASHTIENFTLTFNLPQIKGSPELARMVRSEMQQLVKNELSSLREQCKSMRPANGGDRESCDGEQDWGFEVVFADNNLLSIRATYFSYTKGTAHPSHGSETFTWAVPRPRLLALSDLFAEGARFLRRISELAGSKLSADEEIAESTDAGWIKRGTAPRKENFRAWNVTEQGLLIRFDEYQVAAYAAGPQEIEIRFAEVADLLRPNGPVAYLVKP